MLGWVIAAEQRWTRALEAATQRRMLVASCLALGLAVVFVVASTAQQSPLCALYTSNDVMWWVLGCWASDPPPPPPWP
jgi:hypothetical protein